MASKLHSSCGLPAGLALLLVLELALCAASLPAPAAAGAATASARRALRVATPPASDRKWADRLNSTYLSNAELGLWMAEFARRCAPLGRRFSIGTSAVDKQPLWVLEISDHPGVQEPEPNFKYVANMHGDETSGRALLPLLAEWLCEHYQNDERATRIVRDMHLFILPSMNPDGFDRGQRFNGLSIDLNRNFPDSQENCQPSVENCLPASLMRMSGSTPEVQAIMRWSVPADARKRIKRSAAGPPLNPRQFHFTAAANLHEGAVVANYPFDGSPVPRRNVAAASVSAPAATITEGAMAAVTAAEAQQQQPSEVVDALARLSAGDSSVSRTSVKPPSAVVAPGDGSSSVQASSSALPADYNAAPDDATFIFLASTYATNHAWMSDPSRNPEFAGGITNGAAWYDVYGGMQDWDYMAASCMELTLELNDVKYPPASDLQRIWGENREALLALPITAALGGIRGTVTSQADGLPVPATITVDGISWRTYADSWFGFYARPIKPGNFTVKATYPGYTPAQAQVMVPVDLSGVVHDFVLKPLK